jgi:DNA-binding NarL/FixJ family response regulator
MALQQIRILVVDDHAVVREGIRYLLSSDAEFDVVGEAANGEEALALARRLEPDVVVLDISMPGMSGLDVVAQMRAQSPSSRVLVLSIHDHEEYVLQSVRSGAQGYLRKDTSPAELRSAIRTVHVGDSYFSPHVAKRLSTALSNERSSQERHEKIAELSAREREVLIEIAQGATSKEIAQHLGISARTVESHREALTRKLGVRGVAALTRLAVDAGLIVESRAPGLRTSTDR